MDFTLCIRVPLLSAFIVTKFWAWIKKKGPIQREGRRKIKAARKQLLMIKAGFEGRDGVSGFAFGSDGVVASVFGKEGAGDAESHQKCRIGWHRRSNTSNRSLLT